MIGIKQTGIPKYQSGTTRGGLVNQQYSGQWGDRGRGNELQSALENGLSWIGDKVMNAEDYLEDGFNYLLAAPLGTLIGKPKEIPRIINQMREERHNRSQDYAMNPVFDLVSPIKGGWMLKGLMKGSPLEKQLSKAGTININGLQAYLNKASKLEQDVIGRILSTKFAGQKNIDYNALRKAVSDELITYSRKPQTKYSTYGMDRLGFNKETDLSVGRPNDMDGLEFIGFNEDTFGLWSGHVPGVKTQTFTFESPRIPVGNGKHYDSNTLGHSRTYTTPDESDILHVIESQSDWGQNKIQAPYSGTSKYLNDPQAYRNFIDGHKRLLKKMQQNPENYSEGAIERQIANIEHHENILNQILNGPDVQSQYLHDNYLLRQLQENMKYAAEQGQKRMRYPTPETAAKIEGYKKTYPEQRQYSPEHQTILKKYADFPKMFNKLFKGQEVRTVTDSKGNTWYEVDIPENFLQSEWQFKQGGKLGINKIIGL